MAFAAFIPLIIEAVPAIVKLVEKAFPKKQDGAKTGEQKQDAALSMIKELMERMKKDGALSDVPSDDAIRGLISAIVGQINMQGGFTAPQTTGDLFIVRGSVTPLKV